MRYELTVIVSGELEEKAANERLDGVKKLLTQHGAKEIKETLSGRQSLAYKVNGQTHGYYGTYEFDSEGETVAKVERELKLGGQVMRWLTVQAYKNPFTITEAPKLSEDARSAEELLRRQSSTAPKKARAAKADAPEAEGTDRQAQLDEALGKLLDESPAAETTAADTTEIEEPEIDSTKE